MSLGSRNWFYNSKEQALRFYILTDCVRAKHRSLGHKMVHNYNDEKFQVDVKLLTNGDLEVIMIRKNDDHVADANLKVALIMVDENIEIMDSAYREDAKDKD